MRWVGGSSQVAAARMVDWDITRSFWRDGCVYLSMWIGDEEGDAYADALLSTSNTGGIICLLSWTLSTQHPLPGFRPHRSQGLACAEAIVILQRLNHESFYSEPAKPGCSVLPTAKSWCKWKFLKFRPRELSPPRHN